MDLIKCYNRIYLNFSSMDLKKVRLPKMVVLFSKTISNTQYKFKMERQKYDVWTLYKSYILPIKLYFIQHNMDKEMEIKDSTNVK